jgi:Glycosyl hydrolase 108
MEAVEGGPITKDAQDRMMVSPTIAAINAQPKMLPPTSTRVISLPGNSSTTNSPVNPQPPSPTPVVKEIFLPKPPVATPPNIVDITPPGWGQPPSPTPVVKEIFLPKPPVATPPNIVDITPPGWGQPPSPTPVVKEIFLPKPPVATPPNIVDITPPGWGQPPSSPSIDRLGQLINKSSSLTVDEITEYRKLVVQKPQSERPELLRKLQYKTPYFNQRDNSDGGLADVQCNVTTLASCLTALGIRNPDQSRQFEDVLESYLQNNPDRYPSSGGINARQWWGNLTKLANDFGSLTTGTQSISAFDDSNIDFFKNFVRNNWERALNSGQMIMAGNWTTSGGHIVKVIDIDWNRGLIVDDPFGSAQDLAGNNRYSGSLNSRNHGSANTQQGQDEQGMGNDNLWSWSFCAKVFGGSFYTILGNALVDTNNLSTNQPPTQGSSADFTKALSFTLRWEGGYVNHPNDPGGATNKGITQNTYTGYRASQGLGFKAVSSISDEEVATIYRQNYWFATGSDQLSGKLAMCHFDASVNHGFVKPPQFLAIAQQGGGSETDQARRYCNERENYYRYLANNGMSEFLNGWLNRLNSLRSELGL